MNVNSYQPYARTAQTGRTVAFKADRKPLEDKPEITPQLIGIGLGINTFMQSSYPNERAFLRSKTLPSMVKSIHELGDMSCRELAERMDTNLCKTYGDYQSPL